MHLSVLIPTKGRPHILKLVLESLCRQTEPDCLAEVIVVCDGHDDMTRSVAHAFLDRLPIRYFEQAKRGVSAARNLGSSLATSPLLLLLDDDVVPGFNLISEHINFHTQEQAQESVLLGYVTWHPDLPCTPFMRWFGEYGGLFGYGLLADDKEADVRYFYSCNVSLKRTFLMDQGGFREDLIVLEDNELGFRLARQGMQLFYRKAAVGYHYQTFTFAQSCRRLEVYSSGVNAFLRTDAGMALARRRSSLLFRSAERMIRLMAPLLSLLRLGVDSNVPMPRAIYRVLYWYYGTYGCFWSKADKSLLSAQVRD